MRMVEISEQYYALVLQHNQLDSRSVVALLEGSIPVLQVFQQPGGVLQNWRIRHMLSDDKEEVGSGSPYERRPWLVFSVVGLYQ